MLFKERESGDIVSAGEIKERVGIRDESAQTGERKHEQKTRREDH